MVSGNVMVPMKLANVDKSEITSTDGDFNFLRQQGGFQPASIWGKVSAGLAAKVNWSGQDLTNHKAVLPQL